MRVIGRIMKCTDMGHCMIQMEIWCMKVNGIRVNFTEWVKFTIKMSANWQKVTITLIYKILKIIGLYMRVN